MLHRAAKWGTVNQIILIVGIIIFVMLLTLAILLFFNKFVIQERRSNINNLLNGLHQGDVEILFQFAIPLVADQDVWIIPDRIDGPEDEISIHIAEIGEDYICFRMRSGYAIDMICTPFSNIVSVSYLDMPE